MTDQVSTLLLHAGTTFMGFLAIMNPIANTSIFIGLTAGDDAGTKRAVARNSLLLSFLIIAIVSVLGKLIFELFGITLPAFRITGGILVFFIGLQMLQGSQSSAQKPSDSDLQKSRDAQLAVAVSPLAVPILAGPGTIAAAMNFAAAGGTAEVAITIGAFAVLCVVTYFCFVSGHPMIKFLGQTAVNGITRIMGLILATVGTQMVIAGIYGLSA